MLTANSVSDENSDLALTSSKRLRSTCDMDICSTDETPFTLPAAKRTLADTSNDEVFSKPLRVQNHNFLVSSTPTAPKVSLASISANPSFSLSTSSQRQSEEKFFTPQATKLVKPCQFAFHTTGFLSKKNRPKSLSQPTPDTPSKVSSPYFYFPSQSSSHSTHSNSFIKSSQRSSKIDSSRFPSTPRSFSHSLFTETPIKPLSSSTSHQFSPLSTGPIPLSTFKKGLNKPGKLNFGSPLKKEPLHEEGSRHDPENSLDHYLRGSESQVASPSSSSTISTPSMSSPIRKTPTVMLLPDDPMSCDDDDEEEEEGNTVGPPPFPLFTPKREPAPYYHFHTPFAHFLTPEYFEEQRLNGYSQKIGFNGSEHFEEHFMDYFEEHFSVIEKLGSGSFADAFKVQFKDDGNLYALKRTRQPYIGHKDRQTKIMEIDILWRIGRHEHCVNIINAWEQFGHLYVLMELCEGGTLSTYLEDYCRHSSIDEIGTWAILVELALGLKHIHDSDIVHLDFKPANIFITKNFSLKIGDFGLASALPVLEEREGDRQYMAPEVLQHVYSKPADIFSLGLIILEIAADIVLPDQGVQWQKLRAGDISDCNFHNFSTSLVELIRCMIHPNPQERPTIDQILSHPNIGKILEERANGQCNRPLLQLSQNKPS